MKKNKISNVILIVFGVLTAAICLVMNFYLIPMIESSTQGLRIFDMNFAGCSFEQAKQFLSLLSAEGRDIYLNKQLMLDWFYPIVYLVFFSAALIRIVPNGKKLVIFPVALMISDYCENICTYIMLTKDFTEKTAFIASKFTFCKNILMYVTIALLIAFLVIKLLNFIKKKREE